MSLNYRFLPLFLGTCLVLSLYTFLAESKENNDSPVFTLSEAAAYLKVDEDDVQQLIDSNELDVLKIGSRIRIHKDTMDVLTQQFSRQNFVSTDCSSIPVSQSSYMLPQFLENYYYTSTDSGISGFVVPYCQFVDINGDGLPDYACSYSLGGTSANNQWMNCIWRNTGSGWALFP